VSVVYIGFLFLSLPLSVCASGKIYAKHSTGATSESAVLWAWAALHPCCLSDAAAPAGQHPLVPGLVGQHAGEPSHPPSGAGHPCRSAAGRRPAQLDTARPRTLQSGRSPSWLQPRLAFLSGPTFRRLAIAAGLLGLVVVYRERGRFSATLRWDGAVLCPCAIVPAKTCLEVPGWGGK
jgi:hypothetical protein